MIHRDVKPSNIMMTLAGDPMLTDFGIAKILDLEETADLTGTGMGIGTPEYMAPEQWTGKTSTQSDQYALGVVLYEMLTGRMPYTADTPAAILLMQANDPLSRPSLYTRDLPEKVEKLLLKALAKNPADRYASMGDLAGAMESLLAGTAVPVKEQPAHWSGRAANTRTTVEERLEEPTVMDSYVPQARATQTVAPAPAPQKSRNIVLIIGLGLLFGVLCMSVLAGGGYFIYKQFASPTQVAMPSATGQSPTSTLITTPLATGQPPTSMPITTPTLTMPSGPVEEIFKVSSILKVYNTASAPTTFTINLTWQVTEIMTYHWNNGQGMSSPGTIGLKAADGTMYGPWPAAGQDGQGGVPNASWVVHPNVIIPPGTYTVIDSDPYTWSQNAETGGAGIAWGYGIHQANP
jgi:serine/threonine protein kinase